MGKKILAAVIGYITMAVFIFVTFTIVYLILGTEGAFQPNSYDVSGIWVVASIVLGFAGAVAGGFFCAAIAKDSQTHLYLAGFVLIFGLVLAFMESSSPEAVPGARTGDVSSMEAMSQAQQPSWMAFLNPILGLAGVLVGGRLRKDSEA